MSLERKDNLIQEGCQWGAGFGSVADSTESCFVGLAACDDSLTEGICHPDGVACDGYGGVDEEGDKDPDARWYDLGEDE